MSSTMQPSQGPAGGGSSQQSNRGGRHRGGGGRGGGGHKGPQPAASPGTSLPPGTRFSALGNPLPPLKDDSSAKKENPPTVLSSEPKIEPQMSPRISAPPNVHRNVSTGSSATTQSERSRGEGRDRRRNSNRSGGNASGGNAAVVSDHPPRAAAPQWPNVSNRTPQVTSASKPSAQPSTTDSSKLDFPEVLNAAEWGDDEEHVTQEIIEERLRTQLERVRTEKLALQKTVGESQAELEKVKNEMIKYKSEVDQLRSESDKASTIQKSYAVLRQTRDTLEAERDALKKGLFIAEKDLSSLREESGISITKLTMEVDALKATVEYQKLELEAIKSSAVPAVASGASNAAATTTWVYASLAGSSSDRIADALSFSSLEVCRLNASSWSMNDDAGFRQSLSMMVFERAGERIDPNSPNFAQESRDACARMVSSTDVLLIVPRRPEALSPAKFDEYLVRTVQLFNDAREMARSSKQLAVVLEDFSQNRIVVGNGKVVPVNLILA